MVVARSKGKSKGADKKKTALLSKLKKALEDMPEALRSDVTDVLEDVAELDTDDIQKRYNIGCRLNTMINDESGKYGADARRSIAGVLRLSKDSVGNMVKVAEVFEQDDLDKLSSFRNTVTSERLRWNHIVFLARVPDKEKAFGFAKKAIDEGWTTKELGRAVIRSSGGAKSKGGRKPKRHETLEQSLSDLIDRSRNFANIAESVWLGPEGLNDQFEREIVAVDGTPPMTMLRQLTEACDQGQRLGLQLAGLNQALVQLKVRAEAIRNSKKVDTKSEAA